MSVQEKPAEFKVIIDFKEVLTADQNLQVKNFLAAHEANDYAIVGSLLDIDFYQDKLEAVILNNDFRSEFSNLIK